VEYVSTTVVDLRREAGDTAAVLRMSDRSKENLLVEQNSNLRRYARALLRDRDAAEDLLQDFLARAWNRLHFWRTGTNMRT